MKAFLIDPEAMTVSETEYNGDWQTIGEQINCQFFDVARIDKTHGVFIDDEGMFNATHFFQIKGYPTPLAGRGLLLGNDAGGESVGVKFSLADVKRMVTFVSPFKHGDKVFWVRAN